MNIAIKPEHINTQEALGGKVSLKPLAIREMIEGVLQSSGRLDMLVTNAGIQHIAPLQDFPPEKWDAILAINENHTKDIDFSPTGIRLRWEAGYADTIRALQRPGTMHATRSKASFCTSRCPMLRL